MEVDYSGLEVHIAACYHKDPVMLRYLKDKKHSDMHADIAKQVFFIEDFVKCDHNVLRQAAKNGFVFPEFYGDYYVNCATIMACTWGKLSTGKWKRGQGVTIGSDKYLSDHLIDNGIKSLDDFIQHVKAIETDFWGNRFKVYNEWREQWWKEYQRKGYIDMYTGFRCSGVMGRNNCINYPVQGSAFHCLLWSFNEIDNYAYNIEHWDSCPIGQIHDSIVMDVNPNERQHVIEKIKYITCEALPNQWSWINVPLDVEIELAPVDCSWFEKQLYTE